MTLVWGGVPTCAPQGVIVGLRKPKMGAVLRAACWADGMPLLGGQGGAAEGVAASVRFGLEELEGGLMWLHID